MTTYLLKPFCDNFGGDPHEKALNSWIKEVQQSCFHKEIGFLKNTKSDKAPPLVENLNLFLDETGF